VKKIIRTSDQNIDAIDTKKIYEDFCIKVGSNMELKTVKEILEASGLTRQQLSERFNIPLRTVQNWCVPGGEHRECPVYVRQMMQEILNIK
jgi:DNA-binding transcriptional regulator YiaG